MTEEELSGEKEILDREIEENEENEDGSGKKLDGRAYRRLTPAERVEACELFALGKANASTLSAKYGVTVQALSKMFKANGIVYGERAGELKQAVSQGVKNATQNTVEKYAENRERWIEETRVHGYNDLKTATNVAKKVLADAIKAGNPLASTDANFKAAQRYVRIIREATESRLRLLDATNVVSEDDLPKLVIEDLTAEKIVEFHRENGVDDDEELDEILRNFEKDVEL